MLVPDADIGSPTDFTGQTRLAHPKGNKVRDFLDPDAFRLAVGILPDRIVPAKPQKREAKMTTEEASAVVTGANHPARSVNQCRAPSTVIWCV